MKDAEILGQCPDYISITGLFKATPHTEGDRRFVFCEASNEGLDQQGEVIIAKALDDSRGFFLKYGNCDIDHITKIGPKLGIPNFQQFEIGLPVDVRQSGSQTFVKSEIYKGEGPAAEKANLFWSSIKDLKPAARWYPSVGGSALDRSVVIDPDTKMRRAIIKSVRWSNLGFSKTPVNQHVDACATIPVGAFAKAMGTDGLDVVKALTAGYGTDSATLTGGGAMREQSLQGKPLNYFDFRNRIAKAMREGSCGKNPGSQELMKHAIETFGLSHDESAQHVERFMHDLRDGLTQRRAA